MLAPKFNFEYFKQGGGLLLCPCGGEYMHQERVNVFNPRIEDDAGCHVMVDGPLVQVDRSMEGNPSDERRGLTIEFWCEDCHEISVLSFTMSQGHTYVAIEPHPEVSWRLP